MLRADERAELLALVTAALDEVLDPCSIGRGVPAGLPDMGMVVYADVSAADGSTTLDLVLRMTAPGCTFQPYFEQQVRARLAQVPGLDRVELSWSEEWDWSNEDMSERLTDRLRAKRRRLQDGQVGAS